MYRRCLRNLDTSNKTGTIMRLKRCKILTEKIAQRGHVPRPRYRWLASHTTDVISGLQLPRNLTEPRSFMRLCDLSRRFVLNFVLLVKPLNPNHAKQEPSSFKLLKKRKNQSHYNTKECAFLCARPRAHEI